MAATRAPRPKPSANPDTGDALSWSLPRSSALQGATDGTAAALQRGTLEIAPSSRIKPVNLFHPGVRRCAWTN